MNLFSPRLRNAAYLAGALLGVAACSPDSLTTRTSPDDQLPSTALTALTCTANIRSSSVSCQAPAGSLTPRTNRLAGAGDVSGIRQSVIGGQDVNVRLTSSNVSYDAGTEIFQFDVSVQNLLNEALGSINGLDPDPDGIKVFFYQAPTTTSGSGSITVLNKDGTGTFNGSNQDYFLYSEVLANNDVSAPKTWQFSVPPTVNTFSFTVYLATRPQVLLVINEVFVNPGGTILDANGEWFEVYNAGSRAVQMEGLFIVDSAASGRRPYHRISSSLIVPAGGYVTFGNTTNTTNNGGATIDYAYGTALQLPNSLDAIKISSVIGTDTVTIDYTRYSSSGISAQNGISRELTNPSLDNLSMDGSNWADALVTAVFGPAGRGTPKARNSTYVP